jgi:hypothetical protein
MNRAKSLISSIGMTKWFLINSWSYMGHSRLEFFKGVVPAWFRFTVLTYSDFRGLADG